MTSPTSNKRPSGGPSGVSHPTRTGFSLIEVVVAVGIFAVAISIVIGLLAPVSKSVAQTIDSNTANRVTTALTAKLAVLGYAGVQKLLYSSTTDPNSVSLNDANLLFANKDGDQVGVATDPIWGGPTNNARQYFEIMLMHIPNTVLSPVDATPATSSFSSVLFSVRITWPAYQPDSSGQANSANPPIGRAQRSVLLINSAIAR